MTLLYHYLGNIPGLKSFAKMADYWKESFVHSCIRSFWVSSDDFCQQVKDTLGPCP